MALQKTGVGMPIDDLQDVVVTDGEWHTAPNHTRPQTCVDEIDVEVDFLNPPTVSSIF